MVTCLIDYRYPRKGAKGSVRWMATQTAAVRPLRSRGSDLPVAATAAVVVGALGLLGVLWQAFEKGLGSKGNVPTFILITLNGLTLAGLYFISASGLTLIFGLLRVTNLAHGALFLLGGYVALTLARTPACRGGWPRRWRCWPAAPSAWSCTSCSCAGTRARTCGRR